MAIPKDDALEVWSEETYTLRNVVYKVGLPTVVKVSEGIYGDNEAESFSCGDLIKLDFIKSMTKVSAKFIDSDTLSELNIDQFGYHKLKDEILIPIEYKGHVKVIYKNDCKKKFHSVEELVKEFPRYVRVETRIQVVIDRRSAHLEIGSKLELDRYIPEKGLVCRLNDKDVVLNHKLRGVFTLIADDNIYCLKDIVENFPLPQYVKFLDDKFMKLTTEDLDVAIGNFKKFCGCMKIQRVLKQKVMVGHHKALRRCRKTHCERFIALLPLDSLIVTEILVHVPMYTETDDYQLILARNFSQQIDTNDIDGVIYLEFAKNSRARFLCNSRFSPRNIALPPPLPPRRATGWKKSTKDITDRRDVDYDDAFTPATPKLLKNMRQKKHFTRKHKFDYENCKAGDNHIDGDLYIEPIRGHSYIKPLEWQENKYENMSPIAEIFSSQNTLIKHILPSPTLTRGSTKCKGKSFSRNGTRPKMPLPPLPIPPTNDNDNLYLRVLADSSEKTTHISKSPKMRCSKAVTSERERKRSQSDENQERRKQSTYRTTSNSSSEHSNTNSRPGYRPVSFYSRDDNDKVPLAMVKPRISRSCLENEESSIKALSVEELVVRLKDCGLSKLAKLCDKEMLDGAFINGLSIDELKEPPFCLLPVQLKKIELMKEGWRARRMFSLPRSPRMHIQK